MNYDRKNLMQKLNTLLPAITKNKDVAHATDFIFCDNKIITYNGNLCVSSDFKSDIVGAVDGKTLFNLLNAIKEDHIEITQTENNLIIKTLSIKSKIKIKSKIENEFISYESDLFIDLDKGLFNAIKKSIFSASLDDNYFPFNCIYVNNDTVISCDNIRATKININNINNKFLMPLKIAKILVQYNSFNSFYCDKKCVHFKADDVVYSFHSVLFEYPDVSSLFELKDYDEVCFPIEIFAGIESAIAFNNETISVEIKNGICKTTGGGVNGIAYGTFKIDSNISLQFNINPVFFKEILQLSATALVGINSLLFNSIGFNHVLSKSTGDEK